MPKPPLQTAAVICFGVRLATPVAAVCGPHEIDRQPVQPGPEGALASKRAELLPAAHEHVLCELGGPRPIAAQPEAQREHAPRVLAIEDLERALVAGLRAADDFVHGERRHMGGMPVGEPGFRVRPRLG